MRVVIFFILVFANSFFSNASECSCVPDFDLSINQLIDADIAFKGHLISIRREYFVDLGFREVATFFIDELISGHFESNTIDIEFGNRSWSCSPDFQLFTTYLVISKKEKAFPYFQTGYCSGNKKWKDLSKGDHQLLFDFQNEKNQSEWTNQFDRVYARGKLIQKKPVGLWEYFYFDGKISESGSYLFGKKEGEWFNFFHPLGVCVVLDLPFVGPLCDLSRVIPPHPAGWVSLITPYKNGRIDGTVLMFTESGCIQSETLYKEGNKIGSVKYY